jgi:hypothetical protein
MKRKLLLSALVLFVCIVTAGVLIALGKSGGPMPERLSDEQIAALREQYPLGRNTPPLVSMSTRQDISRLAMEVQMADTILRAKVLGDAKGFSLSLEEYGTVIPASYSGYSLEAISDSAGLYPKGTVVDVYMNSMFINDIPKLKKGMEVIVMPGQFSLWGGRNSVNLSFLYYVTKDGYVLAAYDMPLTTERDGMRVEALIEDLVTVGKTAPPIPN